MGLHLCFELNLPETCQEVGVTEILGRLRDKAVALPFEAVTPLLQLSGDECEAGPLSQSAPLEWWFKCATTGYRDNGDHGVAVEALVATGLLAHLLKDPVCVRGERRAFDPVPRVVGRPAR